MSENIILNLELLAKATSVPAALGVVAQEMKNVAAQAAVQSGKIGSVMVDAFAQAIKEVAAKEAAVMEKIRSKELAETRKFAAEQDRILKSASGKNRTGAGAILGALDKSDVKGLNESVRQKIAARGFGEDFAKTIKVKDLSGIIKESLNEAQTRGIDAATKDDKKAVAALQKMNARFNDLAFKAEKLRQDELEKESKKTDKKQAKATQDDIDARKARAVADAAARIRTKQRDVDADPTGFTKQYLQGLQRREDALNTITKKSRGALKEGRDGFRADLVELADDRKKIGALLRLSDHDLGLGDEGQGAVRRGVLGELARLTDSQAGQISQRLVKLNEDIARTNPARNAGRSFADIDKTLKHFDTAIGLSRQRIDSFQVAGSENALKTSRGALDREIGRLSLVKKQVDNLRDTDAIDANSALGLRRLSDSIDEHLIAAKAKINQFKEELAKPSGIANKNISKLTEDEFEDSARKISRDRIAHAKADGADELRQERDAIKQRRELLTNEVKEAEARLRQTSDKHHKTFLTNYINDLNSELPELKSRLKEVDQALDRNVASGKRKPVETDTQFLDRNRNRQSADSIFAARLGDPAKELTRLRKHVADFSKEIARGQKILDHGNLDTDRKTFLTRYLHNLETDRHKLENEVTRIGHAVNGGGGGGGGRGGGGLGSVPGLGGVLRAFGNGLRYLPFAIVAGGFYAIQSAVRSLVTTVFEAAEEFQRLRTSFTAILSEPFLSDGGGLTPQLLSTLNSESARLFEAAQVAAIHTVATTKEYVQNLQSALAVGRQIGLSQTEIQDITLRLTLAAGAFGIEQEKVGSSVAQILTGSVRVTNQLARNLGLAAKAERERLQEAIKSGTVYEFLTKKTEGFAQTANEVANNFVNVRAALVDILEVGGARAIDPLFVLLNKLAVQIRDTFVPGGDNGSNPLGAPLLLAIESVQGALITFSPFLLALADSIARFAVAFGKFAVSDTVLAGFSALTNSLDFTFRSLTLVLNIVDLAEKAFEKLGVTLRTVALAFLTLPGFGIAVDKLLPEDFFGLPTPDAGPLQEYAKELARIRKEDEDIKRSVANTAKLDSTEQNLGVVDRQRHIAALREEQRSLDVVGDKTGEAVRQYFVLDQAIQKADRAIGLSQDQLTKTLVDEAKKAKIGYQEYLEVKLKDIDATGQIIKATAALNTILAAQSTALGLAALSMLDFAAATRHFQAAKGQGEVVAASVKALADIEAEKNNIRLRQTPAPDTGGDAKERVTRGRDEIKDFFAEVQNMIKLFKEFADLQTEALEIGAERRRRAIHLLAESGGLSPVAALKKEQALLQNVFTESKRVADFIAAHAEEQLQFAQQFALKAQASDAALQARGGKTSINPILQNKNADASVKASTILLDLAKEQLTKAKEFEKAYTELLEKEVDARLAARKLELNQITELTNLYEEARAKYVEQAASLNLISPIEALQQQQTAGNASRTRQREDLLRQLFPILDPQVRAQVKAEIDAAIATVNQAVLRTEATSQAGIPSTGADQKLVGNLGGLSKPLQALSDFLKSDIPLSAESAIAAVDKLNNGVANMAVELSKAFNGKEFPAIISEFSAQANRVADAQNRMNSILAGSTTQTTELSLAQADLNRELAVLETIRGKFITALGTQGSTIPDVIRAQFSLPQILAKTLFSNAENAYDVFQKLQTLNKEEIEQINQLQLDLRALALAELDANESFLGADKARLDSLQAIIDKKLELRIITADEAREQSLANAEAQQAILDLQRQTIERRLAISFAPIRDGGLSANSAEATQLAIESAQALNDLTAAQNELKLRSIELRDVLSPVAEGFGKVAEAFGGFSGTSGAVGQFSGIFKALQGLFTTIEANRRKNEGRKVLSIPERIEDVFKRAGSQFITGLKDTSKNLATSGEALAKSIQDAVGDPVNGFAKQVKDAGKAFFDAVNPQRADLKAGVGDSRTLDGTKALLDSEIARLTERFRTQQSNPDTADNSITDLDAALQAEIDSSAFVQELRARIAKLQGAVAEAVAPDAAKVVGSSSANLGGVAVVESIGSQIERAAKAGAGAAAGGGRGGIVSSVKKFITTNAGTLLDAASQVISGIAAGGAGNITAGIGGALSSLGGLFEGALGTVLPGIGQGLAIVGSVISFFGQKAKEQAEKIGKEVGAGIDKLKQAFSDGKISLREAITGINSELAGARAKLSGGKIGKKGGKATLVDLEKQAKDAIEALRAQAAEIQEAFRDELEILRKPAEIRDIAQQIAEARKKAFEFLKSFEDQDGLAGATVEAMEFFRLTIADIRKDIEKSLKDLRQQLKKSAEEFERNRRDILLGGRAEAAVSEAEQKRRQLVELEREFRERQKELLAQIAAEQLKLDFVNKRAAIEQKIAEYSKDAAKALGNAAESLLAAANALGHVIGGIGRDTVFGTGATGTVYSPGAVQNKINITVNGAGKSASQIGVEVAEHIRLAGRGRQGQNSGSF